MEYLPEKKRTQHCTEEEDAKLRKLVDKFGCSKMTPELIA